MSYYDEELNGPVYSDNDPRLINKDHEDPWNNRAKVSVDKTFTFGIPEIKALIQDYLRTHENVEVSDADIKALITASDYRSQFDYVRENAEFKVTIKG